MTRHYDAPRMKWWSALVALAVVLGVLAPARAQTQAAPPRLHAVPDEEVTVLAPPPPLTATNPAPDVAAPPDLSGYVGQTITAVDVVLDDPRWREEVPPAISEMRPGDKVSTGIVRRAIDEAVASGHFADASVELAAAPGGVKATIHVMPRKVIDSLRLEAHGAPLDRDELVRDAELVVDGELVGRDLERHRSRIETSLQRRGFPSPTVIVSTRPTGDPLRVAVTIDVHVGAPRKVERRVVYPFGGTRAAIEDAEKSYAVKPGARADETALDAADATLQTRIRGRGWHKAEVSHDMVLHKGFIVLRVRVDFGTHYETRYEGNEHLDKSTLDDVLDLENETDRTPNHLAQKITDYYVKHGFLDAEVKLETRGTRHDPINYLVFHVTEQRRVFVAARAYPCLREQDVKRLSEGGPTSAKAIGSEIDSYLDEELPGNDLLVTPDPRGLDDTIGPLGNHGTRPVPMELDPSGVYAPETYERAVQHVQELYRSEGFLAAQVGPVQILRRSCDPRSPPGECRPVKRNEPPTDLCTYDASGLPLSVPPLEQGATCVPDPGRGITCESRVWLRIPVKLGPRTQLWDLAFSGVAALPQKKLEEAADVKLGSWVSTVKIDEARRRVADAYKEEGYAFVDVKYALEQSPDRTRARVRFIVSEGEQVFVRAFVLRGNTYTKASTIEGRVALTVGQPYRASDVRKTEERIATLGTFASVEVALENPYVPQRNKVVVITVVERPRQYTEVAPGFSTGEGFRLATEYGHRNLFGNAIQVTGRLQLSYIPTALIIDPTARSNYRDLEVVARLGIRATGSVVFPEVGLGPLVRAGFDGIVVHDLQRDFFITKLAAVPNVNWRPVSQIQVSLFQSLEFNNSRIFGAATINEYLTSVAAQGFNTTDLARQLLVPDGESYVFAQRLLFSWDRRDNAFNAAKGTYLVSGIEHVDGYPLGSRDISVDRARTESHFFKLTETFGGYVCLTHCSGDHSSSGAKPSIRIAALTRIGWNVQLTRASATYPDRLFFMGGVDSMRGWNLNSFIPQDDVDRIYHDKDLPDTVDDPSAPGKQTVNRSKFTSSTKPIRAGDLMVNERVELRIPVKGPFETVLFCDMGNLWVDPSYPFDRGVFPIRAAVGSGVRVQTPVGPLAIDYGFNVTRKAYEDVGAINFAIGLF
ncbi:MAG: outer membrane protein assembly factor YaeT precursor [Labilithrix sp.]|nr:outer membrane protein assembly factor YaeT precursor [Labilithrix sp.]